MNLPEDDPHVVKLLVQYFYESEYSPELPPSAGFDADGQAIVTVPKENGFRYEFPHTCAPKCPSPNYKVYHHHMCLPDTCMEQCVRFICKECTKTQPPEDDATQLLLHTSMYQSADKYDVAGLKLLAKEKFSRSCEAFWDTEQFATAAEHALTTTPDSDVGLRELLYQTIVAHIELLNKSAIETLLSKHGVFARGVLRRLAEDKAGLKPRAKTAG